MKAESEFWKSPGYRAGDATGRDAGCPGKATQSEIPSGREGLEQAEAYLGLSIHSTQAGPRADIPDANVSVAGAPSSCQDVGLPGTPSYSLDRIKVGSAGIRARRRVTG